ncbi:MAG: GntR family transcriptional regulator [Alistipes sp.]|nr:GntR family transcriptional regulator [Alistipes sp.]
MSTIHQVDLVLKHVKELIYSGKLTPGERLPAERRLATQLNADCRTMR